MIERTYYCDNPTCADDKPGDSTRPCHARTAEPPPYLPRGFLEVRGDGDAMYFCCWDCLMKYAAQFPPPEYIEMESS